METYNPAEIEPKWQKIWEETPKLSQADDKSDKPKYYCLDMFPYPSSAGLHVGHVENYTATDIFSRFQRMRGFNVLHPVGWDAFGLPAENYAIKTSIHPDIVTHENIKNFIHQIKNLGISYDWSREIDTSDPKYYKWTQWFFLFLYKNGLAYKKKAKVNWCDQCKTVLANEQVQDGSCDRCHMQVGQKDLEQWFFKITDFIEDQKFEGREIKGLINGLDLVDWPESTKINQKNWIGKSQGINFKEKIKDLNIEFEVYDSIPQTFLAQTFTVIAPEHPLVAKLVEGTEYEKTVLEFVESVKKKKALKKFDAEKDLEGIFTGRYVENPFGTGDFPIWVASYVLADYGTGIVNCSAHDERDFKFAKKYNIPLKVVLLPKDKEQAKKVEKLEEFYREPDGILQEPEEYKGLSWDESRNPVIDYIEKKGFGKKSINYKLRDWLISRQRYWGAPIPIIYCEKCGEVPVPEKDLPVLLPDDVDFKPTGESPLVFSKKFHNINCPKCGEKARRESDTMDTFVCSSWYFLRFADPKNDEEFAAKEKMEKWLPVDLYMGGAEHTVLHLLYARFFTKALRKYGYINFDEPFLKLRHQGMIIGEDNFKMSKSRGNIVNPDDVVSEFGADALRLYEMFMGPLEEMKIWNTNSIIGLKRFLEKVWRLQFKIGEGKGENEIKNLLHKTVKKVTEDIETLHFNTAISQMMILVNGMEREKEVQATDYEALVGIVSPFAPHICEELWNKLGHKESIFLSQWPKYDPDFVKDEEIDLVIQVNGKLRDSLRVSADISEGEAKKVSMESEKLKKYISGKEIRKVIFVKGKLINFVV